jgi:hypothetical protein
LGRDALGWDVVAAVHFSELKLRFEKLRMPTFTLNPPITLTNGAVVVTLEDAAAILHSYENAKRALMQGNVLSRVESAATEYEKRVAAMMFRGWAESEDLIRHG